MRTEGTERKDPRLEINARDTRFDLPAAAHETADAHADQKLVSEFLVPPYSGDMWYLRIFRDGEMQLNPNIPRNEAVFSFFSEVMEIATRHRAALSTARETLEAISVVPPVTENVDADEALAKRVRWARDTISKLDKLLTETEQGSASV